MMNQSENPKKYDSIPVICKSTSDLSDFVVLCYVSGNSRAEVMRDLRKKRFNVVNRGFIHIDHPDFSQKINSNRI